MKAAKWLEVLQASKRQSTLPQRFNGTKVIIERLSTTDSRLLFAVHLRLTVLETLRSMPSSRGERSSAIRVFTDNPFSVNWNCLISINVSMWNKLSDSNKKKVTVYSRFSWTSAPQMTNGKREKGRSNWSRGHLCPLPWMWCLISVKWSGASRLRFETCE